MNPIRLIAGLLTLGIVAVAAITAWRQVTPPTASVALPTESLAHALARCREAGLAAETDPDCQAAWAAARAHFLGDDKGGH